MKVLSVVGARPNFVKIAPILRALAALKASGERAESVLVHTEQHYDDSMSTRLFADLEIAPPEHTLGVGSGTHAVQTAEIMRRFEPVVIAEQPDVVLVVGDVNSTIACALTAAKLGVRVAHVEAGLRSFDRSMPEEINRIATDALASFLFTTEAAATSNLQREGHPAEQIFFVGNVMIDSLRACQHLAEHSSVLHRLGLTRDGDRSGYAVVTMHRPSNVDCAETLRALLGALTELAWTIPVIFPVHPRTRTRIETFGLTEVVHSLLQDGAPAEIRRGQISLVPPLGYVDFLRLLSCARVVLTDSGGIQEETTCLGVPCLTLRENTERPVTVTAGSSILVGTDPARIRTAAHRALENGKRPATLPPLWDGQAANRIVSILHDRL